MSPIRSDAATRASCRIPGQEDRSLLCYFCNVMLGHVEDRLNGLQRMIEGAIPAYSAGVIAATVGGRAPQSSLVVVMANVESSHVHV